MDNKTLVEKISRLLELSEEEAEELYDVVDTLYNEYSSKYIEAILKPEENRELVNQFITVTKQLLEKENRSFIEELALNRCTRYYSNGSTRQVNWFYRGRRRRGRGRIVVSWGDALTNHSRTTSSHQVILSFSHDNKTKSFLVKSRY